MNDLDVRIAARRYLGSIHADDPNTRIVEEMSLWAGSTRVDLAVINGELTGIELKSDRDTLERLDHQKKIYCQIFDKLELIVGKRHLSKARRRVPSWWGILVATMTDSGVVLTRVRDGSANPNQNASTIAALLWRSELLQILEKYNSLKGWKRKPVKVLCDRLANCLSLDELRFEVREILKRRQGWLGQPIDNEGKVTVG